jgi:hypothetical protein
MDAREQDAYSKGLRVGKGQDSHSVYAGWLKRATERERKAYDRGRIDGILQRK